MMQVYPIRADKRNLIPAVTHVDGSGRLQTVNEADNDRYYRLIKRFFMHTGVPLLLIPHLMKMNPLFSPPLKIYIAFLEQVLICCFLLII